MQNGSSTPAHKECPQIFVVLGTRSPITLSSFLSPTFAPSSPQPFLLECSVAIPAHHLGPRIPDKSVSRFVFVASAASVLLKAVVFPSDCFFRLAALRRGLVSLSRSHILLGLQSRGHLWSECGPLYGGSSTCTLLAFHFFCCGSLLYCHPLFLAPAICVQEEPGFLGTGRWRGKQIRKGSKRPPATFKRICLEWGFPRHFFFVFARCCSRIISRLRSSPAFLFWDGGKARGLQQHMPYTIARIRL
ncbi:hypothetical protein CSUI_007374 [Cystoisospora suis]|uniref:Uncharacterized protein n=1 Tax=Cystoisospora suis TaxID=483139 RepID=A0A2C6KNV6_9APIC|nr:hypothetical protein CSUI_007374 [Cystoisospora suis]